MDVSREMMFAPSKAQFNGQVNLLASHSVRRRQFTGFFPASDSPLHQIRQSLAAFFAHNARFYYLPSCHSECSMSMPVSIIIYDLQLTAASQNSRLFSMNNIFCAASNILCTYICAIQQRADLTFDAPAPNFRPLNICGRVSICGARAIIYARALAFVLSRCAIYGRSVVCQKYIISMVVRGAIPAPLARLEAVWFGWSVAARTTPGAQSFCHCFE
jgi:hypothetical protein